MRKKPTDIPSLVAFFPSLRRASSRALSLYFPVRYEGYDARFYDRAFREMVKKHRHRLSDKDNAVLDRELARVRAHLSVLRPAGCPAMAAFADEPKGVLEVIRLPEEAEERLEVGPLLLAPMELLLRKHPPALVIAVDKERVETYASVLDEVIPLAQSKGVQVKHVKSGGNKEPALQRRADNRAKANLEQVVRLVETEMRAVPYRRLFLAGPDEARAELADLLPVALKKLLAGHLSASFDYKVGELEAQLRKQIRERALVVAI
jgi:hypothetical protein